MRVALLFLGCGFALAACSTDSFVEPDGATPDGASADGGDDGSAGPDAPSPDAEPIENGVADAVSSDAPIISSTQVQCAAGTCVGQQACCQPTLGGWNSAACKPSSSEGQSGCMNFLACDDSNDCPGQVCCATESLVVTTMVIGAAKCTSSCGQNGTVQLCSDSSQCGSKSCQDFAGNPSWLKSCQ